MRSECPEKGDLPVEQLLKDRLFDGIDEEFNALHAHVYFVTCPPSFVILARSEKCSNQVMRHQTRPIYSVQFHAEKSPTQIIRNFVDIVKSD